MKPKSSRKEEYESEFRGSVSRNAHEQKTKGSQYGHLALPQGVNVFKEPSSGRVKLDIMPYIVSSPNHPDRSDQYKIAIVGKKWYRRPYKIHRNVGPNKEAVVCLGSVGKACPICEYRAKRRTEGATEEELKALGYSKRSLYVVIPMGAKDPEGKPYEEKPYIWDISDFCFQSKLNDEIEEDPDNEIFPDLKKGLTLNLRFSEEVFGKNKFGKVSRIDFEEREEEYDEDIMDDIPDLDSVITLLSYDQARDKLLGLDSDSDTDSGDDEDDEPRKAKKSKKSQKSEDEEKEEEEPEEEEPTIRRKSKKATSLREEESFKKTKKKSEDDDEAEEEEEEEEEEDDTVQCKACKGTGKNSKGGVCHPCRGTGRLKKKEEMVSKNKCPHGHTFGEDCDEYPKDCDTCEVWDKCIDAKESDKEE